MLIHNIPALLSSLKSLKEICKITFRFSKKPINNEIGNGYKNFNLTIFRITNQNPNLGLDEIGL